MMSKVFILIKDAFGYAGTEKISDFMCKVFSKDGNEVEVLSLLGSGDTFYPYTGVSKIVTFSDSISPLFSALRYISKNKPSCVFVISMGRLSVEFSLMSIFFDFSNIKTFSCEHVAFFSFPEYVKKLKKVLLKKYDKVIVLTKTDCDFYNSIGIKSVVIKNPMSHKGFIKNSRTNTCIAVGRLTKQKGFDKLLHIWAGFIKNNPSWTLNIVGDGELKDELILLANELDISFSVNFKGKISNVDELYNKADIYLMTSNYEGLPFCLLEAKSWGVPIISFDCPTGPRDIVNDNEDGFLIEKFSNEEFLIKLNLLSDDDELFYSFSNKTSSAMADFLPKRIGNQWLSLLNERKL